jgi:hypothetical protein
MRNYFRRGFLPFYCFADDDGGGGGGGDGDFVGSDGTFNDGWTNGDAFKENAASLSVFKNVTDLANSYVATKKKFGKNPDSMVEIPSETSGDDVRVAWGKANGVPDTVEGYAYDYSDDFATKLGPISDERMAALKDFAHKELGLSPTKFQKMLDFYHANVSSDLDLGNAQMKEMTDQRFDEGTAILKDQWLDGTDARTAAALAHLQKYGEIEVKGKNGDTINPLEKLFEEAPQLKQSPWLTMIMDSMAQKMGEAGRIGGGGDGALSLDGINSQIADVRAKQNTIKEKNPVNYKGNPEFKRLENSLKTLYQKKPA